MTTGICFAAAVVAAVALTGVAAGQTPPTDSPLKTIRIAGRVYDSSGAPIPNASVTLRLTDHSETASTTRTEQNGMFVCVALSPNTYELSVESLGFTPFVKNIRVDGAKDLNLGRIVLPVGTAQFMDPVEPVASPLIAAHIDHAAFDEAIEVFLSSRITVLSWHDTF